MKKEDFEQNLKQASEAAIEAAKLYVVNVLPKINAYKVHPNRSFDGNPLKHDETLFPNDTRPGRQAIQFLNERDLVEFLWRDGKIPEWIDINVESEDGEKTYLTLVCCGRFTERDDLLYHKETGRPPFSVKSPCLPPKHGHPGVWTGEKFDLNWMKKMCT